MNGVTEQMGAGNSFGDLSIRDFLTPLFRRRRLLLLTFGIVFGLVVVLGLLAGPSYSARMVVLVNRERQDPLVSTEATTQLLASNEPVTPEEINSEVELLSSRDVLEQVVTENGLDKPTGFSIVDLVRPRQTNEDRIARAVKQLAKKLKIANLKDSNLIEVSYASPDPKTSYGVINSLGNLYVAKHVAVHRPAGSFEFFAQETQKYYSDLMAAEDKLRTFGLHNSIAAPDEQQSALATQVAEAVGQQHATEQTIAVDRGRIANEMQERQGVSPRSTTVQVTSVNDTLIANLKSALLAAQTRRIQLAMKYDSKYPLVQETDDEITQDQSALTQAEQKPDVSQTTDRDPTYELLREDIVKSGTDMFGQRANLVAIKHSIESMRNEMVRLGQLSLTQQDLQREVKADESNYLLYLGKREQERTSNALDITRIANVAIAVPPAIPALPVRSVPILVLIAFGLAIALSLGIAYMADFFDSSFHTPAQLIEILGIPTVLTVSKKAA